MAQETRSEFVIKIADLLKQDDTVEALKEFSDFKNEMEVKNNSWELIPVITPFLSYYYKEFKINLFKCCEQFINNVAENSNPEEALLQLIEEIEECNDDTKFLTLIKPLHTIILRIPKKRINSLAWAFNSIQMYLNKCEIPQSEKLVGAQKILLNSDKRVISIVNLYNELLFLYDEFIIKLPKDTEDLDEQKSLIFKFLIDLLGIPFVYLDVEVYNKTKSKARVIAEKIVINSLSVNCDPISLLQLNADMKNGEIMSPNGISKASLFYLVYHEEICIEKVPKVFSPCYIFHNGLNLANQLLDFEHNIVIEKGLNLAGCLLRYVKHLQLPYLMLDSEYHSYFCKCLTKIIVYNELSVHRYTALQLYKQYLSAFESKGFYLLVYNLMSVINHSGLIGYTITLYKENLLLEFSKKEISNYFRGDKLLNLLKKFCFLHKNEETDLIEISDQIIASLNLLRYLAIRDKENITEIWDFTKILENIFYNPLRKGIDLSRAHYELKIKEIKEGKDETEDIEIDVVVGGRSINNMPKSEKLHVLQSALTVFDMLESLLTRLLECIECHYNKK